MQLPFDPPEPTWKSPEEVPDIYRGWVVNMAKRGFAHEFLSEQFALPIEWVRMFCTQQ